MKNIIESKHIIFYTCYVDDILIIYNYTKITSTQILHYVNTIDINFNSSLHLKLKPLSTF
jgi:hypothetical protein